MFVWFVFGVLGVVVVFGFFWGFVVGLFFGVVVCFLGCFFVGVVCFGFLFGFCFVFVGFVCGLVFWGCFVLCSGTGFVQNS